MSQYQISFDRKVKKDFKAIAPEQVKKIKVAIAALADNPRPPGCIKLRGKNQEYFRIRVGNYRVIYSVKDKALLIRDCTEFCVSGLKSYQLRRLPHHGPKEKRTKPRR